MSDKIKIDKTTGGRDGSDLKGCYFLATATANSEGESRGYYWRIRPHAPTAVPDFSQGLKLGGVS